MKKLLFHIQQAFYDYCKENRMAISFNTEKIKVFDNLKNIFVEDKEANFKEEKQTI